MKLLAYKKGRRREQYVEKIYKKYGWVTIRAAASGRGTKDPKPDLAAFKDGVLHIIEVKSKKDDYVYIKKAQIENLKLFAKIAKGRSHRIVLPLVVVNFPSEYRVYEMHHLSKTPGNYRACRSGGVLLREFLGGELW